VTICHRCRAGRLAQEGMPLSAAPIVMNQKTSPSDADCVGPSESGGMFQVPLPLVPWQKPQFVAYNLEPAATVVDCPAYGFFICALDGDAL
jgi:hypothetical protein